MPLDQGAEDHEDGTMTASNTSQTRRQVLLGLSSVIPAMSSARLARAASSVEVHEMAAEQARNLVNGRALTIRLLLPNGSGANVSPIVDAFTQATGISVRLIETPVDDINLQLTLDALGGEGAYDLALPATFGLPDLVEAGAIIPISDYARKYEPANFRDEVLYRIGDTFDDQVYGFQTDGDAYVMFYHKGFLEDPDEQSRYSDTFGRALATPDTWEELDRQIQYFNRPSDGRSGGLLFRTPSYVTWEWWVRFHAKGVWPLSQDLTPQIAGDAGVTALEELIRVTQHLDPATATLGLFENWERYAKGNIYCNIGWGGSQKYLNGPNSQMRNRMIFGPTPGGMVDDSLLLTPYFNWGWNYVVTSQAAEPEIAYLFALFASSSEMSTRAVSQREGYFDPFRSEHYQNKDIRDAYSDEFLDVHFESMQNAIPDLYLAHQGEYFRVLGDWLNRALHGDVTPEEALTRVSENWQLISYRTDFEKQKQRWNQLREKYPQAIANRLRDLRGPIIK